jgi:hypothetical protein
MEHSDSQVRQRVAAHSSLYECAEVYAEDAEPEEDVGLEPY